MQNGMNPKKAHPVIKNQTASLYKIMLLWSLTIFIPVRSYALTTCLNSGFRYAMDGIKVPIKAAITPLNKDLVEINFPKSDFLWDSAIVPTRQIAIKDNPHVVDEIFSAFFLRSADPAQNINGHF